ncbi:hypothetical protein Ancab_018120 [Ancistrocladus abbreviatus]
MRIGYHTSAAIGRKDPGEHWKEIMKDEEMSKATEVLVHDHNQETKKTKHCADLDVARNLDEKSIVKDFEPRPNVSVYHDEGVLAEKQLCAKDFEPRPNRFVYHDRDDALQDKKSAQDFEPRPNVSIYHD